MRGRPMHVLVVVASRHGATDEIAYAISEVVSERGHVVDLLDPAAVTSLEGVDAVVLGSAVYRGQWLESARDLVRRLGTELRGLPVWVFSSGPVGSPGTPDPGTVHVHGVLEALQPVDYQVFAGALDPAVLTPRERSAVRLARAPEGDFRDFGAVGRWAGSIADTLSAI